MEIKRETLRKHHRKWTMIRQFNKAATLGRRGSANRRSWPPLDSSDLSTKTLNFEECSSESEPKSTAEHRPLVIDDYRRLANNRQLLPRIIRAEWLDNLDWIVWNFGNYRNQKLIIGIHEQSEKQKANLKRKTICSAMHCDELMSSSKFAWLNVFRLKNSSLIATFKRANCIAVRMVTFSVLSISILFESFKLKPVISNLEALYVYSSIRIRS